MPKIIENLEESIVLQSRKLLSDKGYKGLNIREIAKNCDIAVGTFYNYFATKDELILEIVREDWGRISDLIGHQKNTNEPCKEKFRKIHQSLGHFMRNYVSIFIEMMNDYTYERMPHHDQFQLIYDKLSELIEVERAKGGINSTLSSYKLAQLILANLIYLNMNRSIGFDEWYDTLRIWP